MLQLHQEVFGLAPAFRGLRTALPMMILLLKGFLLFLFPLLGHTCLCSEIAPVLKHCSLMTPGSDLGAVWDAGDSTSVGCMPGKSLTHHTPQSLFHGFVFFSPRGLDWDCVNQAVLKTPSRTCRKLWLQPQMPQKKRYREAGSRDRGWAWFRLTLSAWFCTTLL